MSSTQHNIVVQFSQVGLDQVNGSMKTFASTSGVATKSQDALGGAMGKTQGSALKLRSDIDKGEKSTAKANITVSKYTTTQDKAAKGTQSFAEKFRGNRGLIFSVTGIVTAGVEAIGMFQNFQNALAKQHAAQDELNRLEQEGITTGRAYTQAQRDLDDANRSVSFALRIMALSMGDLIPYTLLIVNQFLKDRIESFDDYYPCIKEECDLFHVYSWIQFFVSMYNYTIVNNNNDFLLKEVNIILN